MNAQEQIKVLRRACEMAKDWFAAEVAHQDFVGKWGVGSDGLVNAVKDALAATETPPDPVPFVTSAAVTPRVLTDEELSAITTDVATLRKERDEALAKLAAAQKEIANIYAAKLEPEPEYRASGCFVQRRGWEVIANTGMADNCEAEARRIADALNGGGR